MLKGVWISLALTGRCRPFRRPVLVTLLRFWLVNALTGRGALEIGMLWIGSVLVLGLLGTIRLMASLGPTRKHVPRRVVHRAVG